MRCKFCLQVFTHPSPDTKVTGLCSICRGIKTKLKQREMCEKTTKILMNRENTSRNLRNLFHISIIGEQCFIQHDSLQNITVKRDCQR